MEEEHHSTRHRSHAWTLANPLPILPLFDYVADLNSEINAPLNRLNSFTFLTRIFGLLLGRMFFAQRFGLVLVAGRVVIGVQMIATKPRPLSAEN